MQRGIDGVNLTRHCKMDAYGDVVQEDFVPTPQVQGGVGSINEDRLCTVVDIERCLPVDHMDRAAVLAFNMLSRRRACNLLHDLTGRRWSSRKLYQHYDKGMAETRWRLIEQRIIPIDA